MFTDWLQKKTSVEAAERENLVHDERLGQDPLPFGFQNDKWKLLLKGMQAGDELWEFSSPPKTWEMMCGRAGIALIRRGEVMAAIITVMN